MILGLIFYVGGKKNDSSNVSRNTNVNYLYRSSDVYDNADSSSKENNEDDSGIIYDERQNEDSLSSTVPGVYGIDTETGEQEEILMDQER
jgi:hypothetical protein